MSKSFLVIQTAFTGDVILASSIIEKLHDTNPGFAIDILVRDGNQSLFNGHPFLREVIVWKKKQSKYLNLFRVLKEIRKKKYDAVINLQRYASTGLLTAFSGGKEIIGFNKNPLSIFFSKRIKHKMEKGIHEIERNQETIRDYTEGVAARPKLYPSSADYMSVQHLKHKKYITIAPVSVWHTKTFPYYKWIELIDLYSTHSPETQVYLLGSKEEFNFSEKIISKSISKNVTNLCGSLSFLESAALMKDSQMNYVNDSAPLHLAGSVNAPVTVIYCSTVPDFGFGPLSDKSRIIETTLNLDCRPCGLHGYRECPLTHFKCAHSIVVNQEMIS